ncbi:hypothetical protein FSI05_016475, partial [Escherichia coli]|nr:hypothetical protein [Escherichia coli]
HRALSEHKTLSISWSHYRSGIISHGRNKLLELAGKCHSEELWSPVRCAFTGALTLYYYFIGFFGILAAIAITLVWQRHTRFFH